jgi:type III pantothenate kinase
MLLAIDAGNTNVVFALVEGREIRTRWRIATDPRRTADEYAVWLHQLLMLEGFAMGDVDAVIIATVVPKALHNLTVLANKYFKVDPFIAGQGAMAWPIVLDVADPRTVGADRVVNAIAAHHLFDGDLVVIDFGTATTFEVVDATGAYKGGIIVRVSTCRSTRWSARRRSCPRSPLPRRRPDRSSAGQRKNRC